MTAQTILPANTLSSGFDVANSVRMDVASGDGLERSTETPTSQRIFTFSAWVKRGNLNPSGNNMQLFAIYTNNDNRMDLRFQEDDIDFFHTSSYGRITTDRKFRDASAWYHIVLRVDTTQGTAANRFRLYVNGVQETSFSTATYPDQNTDLGTNFDTFKVGDDSYGTSHFDGYMCEVVFCDGQSLAPTSFGEFDSDSPTIWKPKSVSGLTFGNIGFFLEFKESGTSANSSGIGADTSGNDNHFTVNNLTAIDQTTDTCTNNYATLNPLLEVNAHPTYSEGNLKFAGTGSTNFAGATIPVSSGKWFVEVKCTTASGSYPIIGVIDSQSTKRRDGTYFVGSDTSATNPSGFAVFTNGDIYHNDDNNFSNLTTTYGNGDIIGLALNMDAATKTLGFYKNGTLEVTVNLDAPPSGAYMFASAIHSSTSGAVGEFNFGNPPFSISSGNSDDNGYGSFEFSVPSGYYALNTKNLAEYG